jgi:hypothetical protein
MKNLHVKLLALVLTVIGVGLIAYKASVLGLPLKPTADAEVWTVQARLLVSGGDKGAKVELAIPDNPPNFIILDEDFISTGWGLAVNEGKQRVADWAIRRAGKSSVLYYRVTLADDPGNNILWDKNVPAFPEVPVYPEPYGAAIRSILNDVRDESADISSYTRELLQQLNSAVPNENIELLRSDIDSDQQWVLRIQNVLDGARIPSRILFGLKLGEAKNHAQLTPWLQVHNGDEWLSFDPKSGTPGLPAQFLLWKIGDNPTVRVNGVEKPSIQYSVTKSYREMIGVASKRAANIGSKLMEYSLFNLPVQTQNVYRVLLTVPIGALLVVFLRNLIGIKTFGTFMPILIALAFRETELIWGVILFSTIVAIGLLFRFYLEKLRLLLVPRLTAVVTIVVLLLAVISVASAHLGLERGLSIALFPMVILAMTIERMSLVWEERGASEAMMQGAGSLVVACIGYLVMTNGLVSHFLFVFPETLLLVLAVSLLMGRYTGYRLTELFRFKAAIKDGGAGS